jgi:Flp pilus assembly protein TadG
MRNSRSHGRCSARARNRRQRGGSMIEFALVAVALVLVMLGGIELDRMILVYTNLTDAVAAGVRYAVVQQAQDETGVETTVTNYATGINKSNLVFDTPFYFAGDSGQAAGAIGSKVVVTVHYTYDPWVSGILPSGMKLTAISKGIMLR